MKLLLIAALAITVLACSSIQVVSGTPLSSSNEVSRDEFGQKAFINLKRVYIPYYHHPHHTYHHYTPVYPPQYIPPYQPPPYQPQPYQPQPYQPQPYQPPQYPPQYRPHQPSIYPTPNPLVANGNCSMCTSLVSYLNQYGGHTAFSRNSALHNACNVVGAMNLAGCQHFVAINGANLMHYLHPQSDPIGICQIIHVC